MAPPVRKVVVVGGGAAGWIAAASLARAFAPRLDITVVESEEIGIVGVGEATIPQIRLLNDFLGLDENEFLRRTQGTIKLGIEFQDWGALGDRYIHAFGDIGAPLGLIPFHHYWLRAVSEGQGAQDLWTWSLNAKAAYAGRFARLDHIPNTKLLGVRYAFHFDAALYAQFLRTQAENMGARRVEGKIVETSLHGETGRVRAVRLESGAEIAGDLFVDCSGFRGLLIEQALKTGYEDWTRWLPCDRAVAAPCARVEPIIPYTRATARKAGWQWRIPLQHRTGNGHVFSSAHISEDEATSILLAHLDGQLLAEPRVLRFTTGMRKKQWNRNVVSLGLASGFLEPLESTSIHLIQSGVSRLITMFPDLDFDEALINEFNRQSRFEFERIRNFIILHYKANERTDSPFWIERRECPIPEELAAKIALFEANGRIYREHEELFAETGWLQVMIGQRLKPRSYNPLADALTSAELKGFLGDLEKIVARTASALPTHGDFLKTVSA
jgi:tryptophan halogenase